MDNIFLISGLQSRLHGNIHCMTPLNPPSSCHGLVLTGGGARGAYQVGVLLAVSEIIKKHDIHSPFPVITGCSAGAINAMYMASRAHQFHMGVKVLKKFWENISVDHIYKSDVGSLARMGLRLLFELTTGSLKKKKESRSLLDTTPLRYLIQRTIHFDQIQKNIDNGTLRGIALSALNYSTGNSRSFYQGASGIAPWERVRRRGVPAMMTVDHLMASAAIPLVFPPVKIGGHYYGDGSLRNYTPLSPAIKLGAKKLMVIGVRMKEPEVKQTDPTLPTLGRVMSVVLNSVLLDAIDLDHENIQRINSTLADNPSVSPDRYSPIDLVMFRPSQDIGKIALEEIHHLPANILHLLKGLGSEKEAADLSSFLLFQPTYTKRLIELGYKDTIGRSDEIEHFFMEK